MISAKMVKELRDITGAGMMDSKNALTENDGDMEAAIDWLRAKGLSKAAKKSGRIAAEGLIAFAGDSQKMSMVEVNSETDFVARNEQFQELARNIAAVANEAGGSVDAVMAAAYPEGGKNVSDTLTDAIATIGENMSLRRAVTMTADNGLIASYMHNKVAENCGKIGVLVALSCDGDKEVVQEIGHQIAMHVAAINPLALAEEDMDASVLEREKNILMEQARESGKPEEVIEKMVSGRMRKFLQESVLLKQSFVINPDLSVEAALKEAEGKAGAPIRVTGFVRFALGEGIEREESDFAAEVQAMSGGG